MCSALDRMRSPLTDICTYTYVLYVLHLQAVFSNKNDWSHYWIEAELFNQRRQGCYKCVMFSVQYTPVWKYGLSWSLTTISWSWKMFCSISFLAECYLTAFIMLLYELHCSGSLTTVYCTVILYTVWSRPSFISVQWKIYVYLPN